MFAQAQRLIDLERLPPQLIAFSTVAAPDAVRGIGNLIAAHLAGKEDALLAARAAARVYAAVQGPEGGANFLTARQASPRYQALLAHNEQEALLLLNEIDCGVVVEHEPLKRQAIRIDAEQQWDTALAVQEAGFDLGLDPADHPRLNRR